jgi:hypothetical protein
MFPQLRERLGPALDLIFEFSTLGEYRLGVDGVLCPASALAPALAQHPASPGARPSAALGKRPARPGAQPLVSPPSEREPQLGGAGAPNVERAAVRRIVAGGAVGRVPAATPAARRPLPAAGGCRGERRHPTPEHRAPRPRVRPGQTSAPEQLCFAV